MKNLYRNLLIFVPVSILIIVFIIFISMFLKAFEEHNKAMQFPSPGTPAYNNYIRITEKADQENAQLKIAMELEKNGQYREAIIKFNNIVETVSSKMIIVIARNEMVNCYEKTGQYDIAIKEIDLIIKEQVTNTPELLERKARLQKLLQK